MTSRAKTIVVISLFVIVATAAAVGLTQGMRRGTAVAATVNGRVIYTTELDREVNAIAQQYGINLKSPDGAKQRDEITRVVLDQIIEQRLIQQEARAHDASASDAQVDAQLAEIKRNFPSEGEFQAALAQRGLTLTELRDRLRITQTMQNLMEKVTTVTATDAEIEQYFKERRSEYDRPEQVRASHILLESQDEARFVLARLQRGEKFGDLAQQYSKDPGSKSQGGDLGFVSRGQLVGEFERAAFALATGRTSAIVKTQFGYHIIKVTDKRPPQPARVEEVRDQIRAQLLSRKRDAAFQVFLKRVKAQAKITRFDRATK